MRQSKRNVIVLLDPHEQYDTKCAFYRQSDQTKNNHAGTPNERHVPINHFWSKVDGPGCGTYESDEDSAARIAKYPLKTRGDAPGLPVNRSTTPIPFTQTQTIYTIDAWDACALIDYHSLLDYESVLSTVYRRGIADEWCDVGTAKGGGANIVIADRADEYFVRNFVTECEAAAHND